MWNELQIDKCNFINRLWFIFAYYIQFVTNCNNKVNVKVHKIQIIGKLCMNESIYSETT